MAEKQTPGAILRDVECYSANLAEFAKELREKLIDPNTDGFKPVNIEFAVATIQTSYNKLQETLLECEGKDLDIKLPDGAAGAIIKLLLEVLGITL